MVDRKEMITIFDKMTNTYLNEKYVFCSKVRKKNVQKNVWKKVLKKVQKNVQKNIQKKYKNLQKKNIQEDSICFFLALWTR